jgi:predicted nucleic acid-binding protein
MPNALVLDCSVAAKWMLPEPDRAPAMRLLEEYQSGRISLIAPDLLLAEFASLLAKRHRRKQISAEQARDAFSLMRRSAPRLFDMRPRVRYALELSLHLQMSFWDCVYLALAIEHDCPFLTADRRLFRGVTARHPSVQLLQRRYEESSSTIV